MPLDADTKGYLEEAAAAGGRRLQTTPVEKSRADYLATPKPSGDDMAKVENVSIAGVPVRIYSPSNDDDLTLVVFFHGGGWVLSSIDGHDHLAWRIAARSGCRVASVDYRLAPEHAFPAAHDDCWTVTRWAITQSTRVVVAGDSAGGNLAASVALRARDEGLDLAGQILIYPCVEVGHDRPSLTENATGYGLTSAEMAWFWDAYVPGSDRTNPYAVPMTATSLAGIAPALVITAEYDPLRDEGEAYAARLAAEGVEVACTRYDGVVHGFVSRWNRMARGEQAHDEIAAALNHL